MGTQVVPIHHCFSNKLSKDTHTPVDVLFLCPPLNINKNFKFIKIRRSNMEKQSASNSKIKYFLSQQPPVQLVVCYKPSKGLCYCSPQRAVSQAFLLVRYKAVLLESSFLDSSACSFIYFCTASSVILPIVST